MCPHLAVSLHMAPFSPTCQSVPAPSCGPLSTLCFTSGLLQPSQFLIPMPSFSLSQHLCATFSLHILCVYSSALAKCVSFSLPRDVCLSHSVPVLSCPCPHLPPTTHLLLSVSASASAAFPPPLPTFLTPSHPRPTPHCHIIFQPIAAWL